MARINENYLKLPGSYLFSEIARRVQAHAAAHPDADIIRLGIGDVTQPLAPTLIEAFHAAVDEMGVAASFHGYGPEQGYDFLREAICADYRARGLAIEPDEIFISDGSKSDSGNIGDILGTDNRVAVTDPVYPVYVDTNAMSGRAGDLLPDNRWSRLIYLPCTQENGFVPELPREKADIIYLCLPNNPTGTTLTRAQLAAWVDYARRNQALILFDGAYEAFITEPDVPRSIYEIEGAHEVAIEFRSFSKKAGFTGVRCAYAVVPRALMGTAQNEKVSLNRLWNRRQTTKFNGVPYVIQRVAAACYTPAAQEQLQAQIGVYLENARVIREGFAARGFSVYGGVNAPYVWLKTPEGLDSWGFFDRMLQTHHIVGTPGAGFGPSGEGYFRLTAFGTPAKTREAMERLRTSL